MGFRKHRRRGGGGGGGGGFGGGHGNHHGYHGNGEPNGLQPGDDVGNRRSFKAAIVPPDDIGNRKDPDEGEWIPEDNVGNRIDAAPTHELSGVLLDLNGKHRRRRPKGVSAPERVGRFFVGGVNPLIATNVPRAFPGKTLEESLNGTSAQQHQERPQHSDGGLPRPDGDGEDSDGATFDGDGRDSRRQRRGRDRGDLPAQQQQQPQQQGQRGDVSERRAQRFFDFEEDDRFDYTLKTPAEQKRKDAEDAVRNVVVEAGRDATVLARLIEDGKRPKVLVTIDERGPAAALAPERKSEGGALFVMGNAALMSLNYLANKIVNRYPDDRIRLAILPAADERLYLDALADHQKVRAPELAVVAPAVEPLAVEAPEEPVRADEGVLPVAPAFDPEADVEAVAPTLAPPDDETEGADETVSVDDKPKARPKKAPAARAKKAAPKKAAAEDKPAKKPVKRTARASPEIVRTTSRKSSS
ncbi:MAG TPA: hypothetical protein VGO62_13515 [Myxococcota bacterium]